MCNIWYCYVFFLLFLIICSPVKYIQIQSFSGDLRTPRWLSYATGVSCWWQGRQGWVILCVVRKRDSLSLESRKKWDRERNKRAAVRKKDAKTRPVSPATGTTWWMSEFSSFATRARLMLHTQVRRPHTAGRELAALALFFFLLFLLWLSIWP